MNNITIMLSLITIDGIANITIKETDSLDTMVTAQSPHVASSILYCKWYLSKLQSDDWDVKFTVYRPDHMRWTITPTESLQQHITELLERL